MSLVHCEIHDQDFDTRDTPMCIGCFNDFANTLMNTDPSSFESIQPRETYEDLVKQVIDLKGKLRSLVLYIQYLTDAKEYPGQAQMTFIQESNKYANLMLNYEKKELTGSSDL